MSPEIMTIVTAMAAKYGLDKNLVLAIIKKESDGEVYTQRYEPDFRYFFDPISFSRRLRISVETERMCQSTSYGLMQVMGAVFRERGFVRYLAECFDPVINIEYGCKHLQSFYQRYNNIIDAVASYNAGSPRKVPDSNMYINQHYIDSVLAHKKKLDGP